MTQDTQEQDVSTPVTPVGYKKYINKKSAIQLVVGAVIIIAILTVVI